MRIKRFLLAMLLIVAAGVALSAQIMGSRVRTEADIVMANQMLKTVESHWPDIAGGDYRGITQPFTVLDEKGNVRFQTIDGSSSTINDAVKKREPVLDIIVDGAPAGKLIIHDGLDGKVQRSREQLAIVTLGAFALLAMLGAFYALFLYRRVIMPFRKLQDFAVNVAQGQLDLPLKMEQNNLFGSFTESFDLMREELAAARQREYEANRSKKELVASLSHDIKTPVSSIKALSELMLLRAEDEKARKQLGMIQAKAEQINQLVTDMFHATLEELQELKVKMSEEYSSVLREMIDNVNYDDQIHCGPVPDCIIYADVLRLQQVFDNILSNAYKYAGTPVNISSSLTPDHLKIDIMDYGKGVSPDELPLLFNKFYRGGNTMGRSGAGLGLFISKYLMQSMNGDVECHNHSEGFVVTLYIRLV